MQNPVTRTSIGFEPASIASALRGLSELLLLLLEELDEAYDERAMVTGAVTGGPPDLSLLMPSLPLVLSQLSMDLLAGFFVLPTMAGALLTATTRPKRLTRHLTGSSTLRSRCESSLLLQLWR